MTEWMRPHARVPALGGPIEIAMAHWYRVLGILAGELTPENGACRKANDNGD